MRTIFRYIGFIGLMLLAWASIVSCEQEVTDIESLLTKIESTSNKNQPECEVTSVNFSEDYKFMDVSLKLNKGIGSLELSDTSAVSIRTSQKIGMARGIMVDDKRPPLVYGIRHVAKEEVAAVKIKILMLVDLSLSQDLIDRELEAVKQVRTLLDPEHLYVSFMQGDKVSESYQATDYILNNYFRKQSDSYIYLYRSVLQKLEEITDSTSVFADAKHKGMIVLSGGKTYDDDRPLDPRHFDTQQRLAEIVPLLNEQEIAIGYAQFSPASTARNANAAMQQATANNQQELGIMRLLCNQTDGLFLNSFDWIALRDDFMQDHLIDYDDYNINLIIPNNKVLRGNRLTLNLDFIDKQTGEELTTCKIDYSAGSVYHPIIVGGKKLNEIIMEGLLIAFLLSLAIYLTLQIVVPWVRYRMFLRHHVIRYIGAHTSKDGHLLDETCYLCKAPFEVGDEVVAKCSHAMHKECWDDNDYHCPEYGRNCKHGSHYYDQKNLFDPHNATFYMIWILAGIFAGLLAWIAFMVRMHLYDTRLLTNIMFWLFEIKQGTPEASQFLTDYSVHLDYQPLFGFSLSFYVTLIVSLITLRNVNLKNRLIDAFLRALVAGLLGFMCFAISCIVAILLGIKTNSMILDSIPWVLMTAIIMFCVTFNTRIRIRPLWLLIACALDILLMYVWTLIYRDTMVDYRLFQLLSFLFTATVISVCIAFEAPKSEHYFLQTSGAIKPLDIALYKWLRADPSMVVTMGQSADCAIHLSWDISGHVEPVHAELRLKRGLVWLKALEKGVMLNGQPLPEGDSHPLYHGNSFTIGNTTFTYVEKDI